tara:strand:- start:2767 stop:4314 length:1548 start_codon:yes stop_codon:yes gene_type:complete
MAFNLPAPQSLYTGQGTDNVGTLGSLTPGRKSGGNLPISNNASQVINTTASNANGVPAGVFFGINGQSATSTVDASVDTRVLIWSVQYNAPNRIQSSDFARGGSRFRLASGSSPTLNYKDYYIGGNDTPFCSAQAGPVTMCIDLADTSHNNEVGTFNLSQVSAYGHASVRLNLVGSSTALTFFQRAFLFTTTKDSANIPLFTGVSSFDDAVALLQGTDYTTKIGSWITKSGSSIFLPCPFQIGDGTSATTFNDDGAAIVSPGSNLAGQENFRLTDNAMRVYANLRNNAADSITLSGSYSFGTAAPWDFDVSNASTCLLSGSFSGMGDFKIGSSVTANGSFNLATGKAVKCNGANIDSITVAGDLNIETSAVTSFSDMSITGVTDFDTAGTYTLTNCTLNEITNSSGGLVTLINDNSTANLITGPNITIVSPPKTLTVQVNVIGADVVVLAAGTDTILDSVDAQPGTDFVFTYTGAQSVDVGVILPGYGINYTYGYSLTGENQSLPVNLLIDRNYA